MTMTTVRNILTVAVIAMTVAACSEKKKNDVIITTKVEKKAPAAPVKMQDYTQSKTIEWLGNEYMCEVVRTADVAATMKLFIMPTGMLIIVSFKAFFKLTRRLLPGRIENLPCNWKLVFDALISNK